MSDIRDRDDIAAVISNFYNKATQDALIGHYFAELDLTDHLPVMYDFWENILFKAGKYQGGMMYKHITMHTKNPLRSEHFERWLLLFCETVDTHFSGPVADEAKQRAQSIAATMQHRLSSSVLLPRNAYPQMRGNLRTSDEG